MESISLRKKRILRTVFCAALTLVLAVQSTAVPLSPVYAEESDEFEQSVGSELLDDVFGEIVIYRWQKLTADNYPNDKEWHPTMFFWGSEYQLSMNAVFPNDVYLDKSHATIAGAHVFGRDGLGDYPLTTSYVDSDGAAAIAAKYAANDTELKNGVGSNVFYTTGDKNCSYILYEGIEANSKKPYYQVRLSNGKGTNSVTGSISSWVMNLTHGKDKSRMGRSTKFSSGHLVFTQNSFASGAEPLIFDVQSNGECLIYDRNEDDLNVYLVINKNWFLGTSKYKRSTDSVEYYDYEADDETALIYFGEMYRYSAIKDDVTIGSGQILSISPDDYADTDNNVQTQNGVILQNGKTITINKGGILSISGEFINNGTIINNGGTILVKDKGTIYPFRTGSVPSKNGCGTIKCVGGDIIIKEGGTVYAGLNDESGNIVPFWLDEGSVLINQGLLVYGSMRMGEGARMECQGSSKTYGSWYTAINLGVWDQTNGLLPEKRKVSYSTSFETMQAAVDSLTKFGYSVAVSAESADKTYCDLYYYWPQGIPQDDMLTKCTSSFQKGETSKVPKTILPAIKYYGGGSKSSVNMLGFGLWTPTDVSDDKLPHVVKGSKATIDDFYFEHRITIGALTI